MAFLKIVFLALLINLLGGTFDFLLANTTSFEIAIIHKLSPRSPFYDPRFNISSLVFHADAGQEHLDDAFQIDATKRQFSYTLSIAIGTPGSKAILSLDTGSDIIWLQCIPCSQCFYKNNPIFDQSKSSTFQYKTCQDFYCIHGSPYASCGAENTCGFKIKYGDDSRAWGDLSSDYFRFKRMDGNERILSVPLTFGCAQFATGQFHREEDGVFGLGQGPFSIISQLNVKKFSQCLHLPESARTSSIFFGDTARLLGEAVPLIRNEWFKGNYFVNLHDMALLDYHEKIKLDVPANIFAINEVGRGGLMLDMGTPVIRIPRVVFDELCNVLGSILQRSNIIARLSGNPLQLCFHATYEQLRHIGLVFTLDSFDLTLTARQLFYGQQPNLCLGLTASNDPESILGTFAQVLYNIGFDIENQMVTFQRYACEDND